MQGPLVREVLGRLLLLRGAIGRGAHIFGANCLYHLYHKVNTLKNDRIIQN